MDKQFYREIVLKSADGYAYHEMIFDQSGKPIDYRFLEVNPAFENITGFKAKDIIGKTILEILPSIRDDDINWIEVYGDVVLNNYVKEFESFSSKLSTWFKILVYPNNKKHFVTIFRDITKTKKSGLVIKELTSAFSNIVKEAPIPIIIHDESGKILQISDAWTELSGYTHQDIPTFDKWLEKAYESKEARDAVIEEIKNVFNTDKRIHDGEFLINSKNNDKLLWDFYTTNIGKTGTGAKIAMAVAIDITEKQRIQEQLIFNKKNLELAQSIAKIGSWEIDIEKHLIWGSKEAHNIYEIGDEGNYFELKTIQNLVAHNDRGMMDKALEDLISSDKPYNVTFRIITPNNNIKYINSRATLFRDPEGRPLRVVGVIHDITELKNKELELERISQRDYLTDLYNRRYYFEQFKKLDNPGKYPLGVMMIDLNGLKIINDAFGHSAGDRALKIIGDMLRDEFEEKDIVARIGGDEFNVLLPNTTPERLQQYKDHLVKIAEDKRVNNIELSVAIGYETKNEEVSSIDEIQKQAENHMYRHKTTIGSGIRSRAINAILHMLSDKYETEKRHSTRVSELCKQMGIALDLRSDEIKELEQAGLFHDIGKISIPDDILKKPGKLTKEEYEIIKDHTEIGYQILKAADEYSELAIHALHHHERWDGLGYPRGLKGTDIPFYSRIIGVIDAYEAMTSDRPYRSKMSKEKAIAEIKKYSGTQFDPELAKIFLEKVLTKYS